MPELIDGFNDLSGGVDSSRSPEVISERHCGFAVNASLRDGMARTRPMWRRVELKVPDAIRTGYYQGCSDYYNPVTGLRRLIAVFAGRIYAIDPIFARWTDLSTGGLVNDATAQHYFCQVERFLVINNGKDGAVIYDGSSVRRATADEIPSGTIMAFGQGRLFVVSPDFRSLVAGDLIYGGSTTSLTILLSSPEQQGRTKVSTTTPHGLEDGDQITIENHYSTPSIIGTWTVQVVTPTSFTIPIGITAGGGGGRVTIANDGLEEDALRFTERNFRNETGIFRLPASMGKITAMTFFPFQDTGTGQGDLMVGAENGACTFRVSEPRETWLNIAIQRVALTEIGFGGHNALAQVNGDIFFAARDSQVRSYRNARAEFGQYGNTPLSAEMQRIIRPNSLPSTEHASMALQDNRLLYTTSPKVLSASDLVTPPRFIFQSLTSLDFQQSSRITKGGLAAYDGIWTGLDFLQLIPANFGHEKRLYAWCWQKQESGDYARANELWEITSEDTGYDSWVVCDGGEVIRNRIECSLEVRAFDFESWKEEKRLTRLDLWLAEMRGADVSMSFYWRPDVHGGGWFYWGGLQATPGLCAYEIEPEGPCEFQPQIRPPFFVAPFRLGTPPRYEDGLTNRLADRGFTFQVRVEWSGRAQIKKLICYAEPLVNPTQNDVTSRQLEDVSVAASWPRLFPPVEGDGSYHIISSPACEYVPCVTFATIATVGPNTISLLFVAGDGPEEIQFLAGVRMVDKNGGHEQREYEGSYENGFTIATLTVIALTEDYPGYAGPSLRVKIVPDNEDSLVSYIAVIPVDACFDQPLLEITLDDQFEYAYEDNY